MEFREVVRRRRMVRDFAPTPVDPAVVERALDHATRAPSAGFTQGWAFLVLDDPADVRRWWEVTADGVDDPDRWLRGMMRAPVLVVPCSSRAAYLARYAETDKGRTHRDRTATGDPWTVPYWHMDTAMAALLILQTAVDEGLGACWFGLPPAREPAVRRAFAIPDDFDPAGVVALGHPAATGEEAAGSPARRARLPLEQVVHRGRWGHPASPPG